MQIFFIFCLILIFFQKMRQKVYNTLYYIVKSTFFTLSYGYPMVILW